MKDLKDLNQQCRDLWEKNKGLKWKYSFMSALIFYILSSPDMYNLTNNVVQTINEKGCPTSFGLLLHSIVFMISLYLIMNLPKDL